MIKIFATAFAAMAMTATAPALAQTEAPAAAPAPAPAPVKKLSVESTVKELLDDARTKAILAKHVPLIVDNAPSYPEIYPMTFRALGALPEAQSQAGLTPEVFKTIEAEVAALSN